MNLENIDLSTGIKIYELAGFEVVTHERTSSFTLLRDGKKSHYFSSLAYLTNMSYIIKTIKGSSFRQGHEAGRTAMQKEIKELLGIEG